METKKNNKILVIEDDEALLETIANILSLEGFEVFQSSDGENGITLAQQIYPDIIVCDVMMPGISGLEVLRLLQTNAVTRTIPFIFLTARADMKDMRGGMLLGADDYITKPFNNEDLLKSIQLRLEKKEQIIKNSLKPSNDKKNRSEELAAKLTKRERQIVKLLCDGLTCNQIGKELLISYHTVDSHRKNIEKKIGVNSIVSIVKFAMENNLE